MKSSINLEILKAMRRDRRNEEISMHGKSTSFRSIVSRNKKKYSRKDLVNPLSELT